LTAMLASSVKQQYGEGYRFYEAGKVQCHLRELSVTRVQA